LRDSAGLSPDFAVLPAATAERRDTGNLQAAPVTVKDPWARQSSGQHRTRPGWFRDRDIGATQSPER